MIGCARLISSTREPNMPDPTKVSTDANMSDANAATGNVADGRLSDGELNAVNGGWGVVSTGPRPTAGKETGRIERSTG